MPIVQIDMLDGRTVEQKREMVAKLTEVIVETAKCPAESVIIILRDVEHHNLAKVGKLCSDK